MNIKEYFSFTRGEKRGALVFALVIVVLIIFQLSINLFRQEHRSDFSEFETAINQFEAELNSRKDEVHPGNPNKENSTLQLFPFDPNTISDKEWKKLGFKDWQIRNINKYRAKGGNWKTKSDVKKIYGLTNIHYQKLAPYILLPDEIKYDQKKTFDTSFKNENLNHSLIIDINAADTTLLKKLKGIGSGYANRIVKYRELLGGFTKIEQLTEIYGLNEDLFNQIKPNVKLNDSSIIKININRATIEELKHHPYINWNIANSIVKIRELNGAYKSVSGIKKSHLINDNLYIKIEPYLKTE